MPPEGQRLHPFSVISGGLRMARQLLLPAILAAVSAGDRLSLVVAIGLLVLAVPSGVISVLQWLAFRYRLEGDELIIDSGVLSRRRRVIPVSRVQNVDIEQGFLERLVGVAELRMETASGGRETEASLAVLDLPAARMLQSEIMRRRASRLSATDTASAAGPAGQPDGSADAAVGPSSDASPAPLLRLSTADLAIAGATSNEAGLIAAGLATLLQFADDFGALERVGGALEGLFTRGAELGVGGAVVAVAGLVVAFFVLGWALSIAAHVVRFHGYTLTIDGDDLRREYGLFRRHRSTVPLERVQAVRVEETLLRRPLKLAALKIETAGAGPQQRGQQGQDSEAFVPIARLPEVGRLLRAVFPTADLERVELHAVEALAMRRALARAATPVIVAAAALAVLVDVRWAWLLLGLAGSWAWARAYYRSLAWGRPPGFAIARGGVMTRATWVVPERKIQTIHTRETPFQRRLGLSTLLIDTAATGRVARVVDLGRGTAARLLGDLADAAPRARMGGFRRPTPEPPRGG